ncbi:MAG: DUF2490 domain-containing protein [Algicola sp.]|nr:DUF2490 domain-containing protein [Algicola sp.]
MKNRLFLLSFLWLSQLSLGQELVVKNHSNWNTLNVVKTISQHWYANAELNVRRTNFLSDWEQIVLRPLVHYKVENNIDIALGYSYIKNFQFSEFSTPIDVNEQNIFQQLMIKQQFSKFSFGHRIRFEERFIDHLVLQDTDVYHIDGRKHKNRFRYRLQMAIPLKGKSISLFLYDEAFLDFGNRLRPEKLDQNWMFAGLIFKISEHIKIRTGYHDIFAKRNDLFINNHVWETTLTYHI